MSTQNLKTDDPDFLKSVKGKNIIILTETHASGDNVINISGLKSYLTSREKHSKARKHSVEIAIFIRNDMEKTSP